ncbi:MAG TPA: type II toxin-antitoxin system HicA family toxin [Phycisphaerae bacterium]|nr:type II toxin-antitoxin system HicA family toxin [Phycisphaerae bacterium]
MGKLTELPTRRILAALNRAGWVITEGAKHYKLTHLTKPGALTVPRSKRLRTGTIRAIIRQAGLSVEEFFRLYR